MTCARISTNGNFDVGLSEIANLAAAAAVVFGVVFGVAQVRQHSRQRHREASFALMRSLQTRDMLRAMSLLDALPENLSKSEIEERLGDAALDLQVLLGTWESLGILVYHGEVSLDLVDDFYSGPIAQSWRKLGRLVEDIREQTHRDTRWEYFQWLSQQMIDREAENPPIPAYKRATGTDH